MGKGRTDEWGRRNATRLHSQFCAVTLQAAIEKACDDALEGLTEAEVRRHANSALLSWRPDQPEVITYVNLENPK